MRGCFVALFYAVAEVGTATEAAGQDEEGLWHRLDIVKNRRCGKGADDFLSWMGKL